jgi:hypothetical protein
MMRSEGETWILAYNNACGACTDMARQIEALAEGRLTVRSLRAPEVRAWRQRTLGPQAPWTPTLLRVEGERVRAWIHGGMVWQLARLLGPGKMVPIARLLAEADAPTEQPRSPQRRRFVKSVGGAALAVTLLSGIEVLTPRTVAAQSTAKPRRPDQFMHHLTRDGQLEGAGATDEQIRGYLATAKQSEHYRQFVAGLEPDFAMDTQATVWSLGDQVSVAIPTLYRGQQSDSGFAAILDRKRGTIATVVARVSTPVASGQRMRMWHDGRQIADVTVDGDGTAVGGWVRRGGGHGAADNVTGQNFMAQGRAAYADYLREFRSNFGGVGAASGGGVIALDISGADLYNCVNTCLSSQGVPGYILIGISIACAVACIGTAGLGCAICIGALSGAAGGIVGYCIGTCERCGAYYPNGC